MVAPEARVPTPAAGASDAPRVPHYSYVELIAASADGTTAVSYARDSLRVWGLPEGTLRCVLPMPDGRDRAAPVSRFGEHASDITALLVDASGTRAVAGTRSGWLKVYALDACRLEGERPVHVQAITSMAWGAVEGPPGGPGSLMATASQDGAIKLWRGLDARMPYATASVGGPVTRIAMDRRGELLAIGYRIEEFGNVIIASTADGRTLTRMLYSSRAPTPPPDDMVFDHDGGRLAVVSAIAGSKVALWDVMTGQLISIVSAGNYNITRQHHGGLAAFVDGGDALLAMSFAGALVIPTASNAPPGFTPLAPDVVLTSRARSRRWAPVLRGDGGYIVYGDQDGNIAALTWPGGKTVFKADRASAPKVSQAECEGMIEHVARLARARAGGRPSILLPDPERFAERAAAGPARTELVADCTAQVMPAELACMMGKSQYDDLRQCDYLGLMCRADACKDPLE